MSTIYTLNGKVLKNVATDKWLKKPDVDPYNPLGLPAGVMRMKMPDGWTIGGYDTASLEFTQVSSSPNIWDMKVKSGSGINSWAKPSAGIIELMGFNPEGVTGYGSGTGILAIMNTTTTKIGAMRLAEITAISQATLRSSIVEVGPLSLPNVTDISSAFSSKPNLSYVVLNDLGNLENMAGAFYNCPSLTSMPNLNGLVKVNNVQGTFADCRNIETGILNMYNTLNALGTATTHNGAFADCGADTVTGAAELAQIPASWGGTGA